MTSAVWYFDFISPFAYLQLDFIERLRERIAIEPRPIAFGAVLAHVGQLGPAEIPSKREFTYRFVQWQAERAGTPLRFPPAHPFNPLAALRLCIANGTRWPDVRAIFDRVWTTARASETADDLADVGRAIGVADVAAAISRDDVKAQLRANTDAAIAEGVFGVPTLTIDGQKFWGCDASAMIEDWLTDRSHFERGEYARFAAMPVGVKRNR